MSNVVERERTLESIPQPIIKKKYSSTSYTNENTEGSDASLPIVNAANYGVSSRSPPKTLLLRLKKLVVASSRTDTHHGPWWHPVVLSILVEYIPLVPLIPELVMSRCTC